MTSSSSRSPRRDHGTSTDTAGGRASPMTAPSRPSLDPAASRPLPVTGGDLPQAQAALTHTCGRARAVLLRPRQPQGTRRRDESHRPHTPRACSARPRTCSPMSTLGGRVRRLTPIDYVRMDSRGDAVLTASSSLGTSCARLLVHLRRALRSGDPRPDDEWIAAAPSRHTAGSATWHPLEVGVAEARLRLPGASQLAQPPRLTPTGGYALLAEHARFLADKDRVGGART